MAKVKTERGRFSSRKKTAVVLRVFRGEYLDLVSRETGITAATLWAWRDHFVAGGLASLKSRAADGLVRVCQEWGMHRSTFYYQRGHADGPPREPTKRSPRTSYTDEEHTQHALRNTPYATRISSLVVRGACLGWDPGGFLFAVW